ncbi:hypothetical protein PHSY_001881 [Pseudozyma hubeiensis SY62]|uniref:Uncharacterized protein n=1 Tax=Pseudozyma hubeiensis (strain SY62) TaxID=1305764 RepID=R9P8B3_PSEHS|nr:hypothetical protein PHSY_001881 [Pseudozyma hubeiensis SY62]GAC94310.1 hypothetical protein PHSY_001881 [Pseudozyma hubeiensis SY62]
MSSIESSHVKHDARVKAEPCIDNKESMHAAPVEADPRNECSEQKHDAQVNAVPRDPPQGAETHALARDATVKSEGTSASTSDGLKPEQPTAPETAEPEQEGSAPVPGEYSYLLAYLSNQQTLLRLLRGHESPVMLSSWACEYLSSVRGRAVTIDEWYDLLGSDHDFPDEAWLWIAQVQYEGYAGDRDSIREIKGDLNEAIDWYNDERPDKAVPQTIRKQCMSILGGRRRWLLRERRFETGQERSDRVAVRRARETARKAARDRERQERYEASEASSSRS